MTSTDLMNLSAFENQLPDAEFAALNPQADNLADGIGSSYGVVGYRGKVWTLRLRGETYTFTRPDDGSPAAFLDVIVLRSAPYKSKSYYPAGSFNEGNSGERPHCSSIDGVTPDPDVNPATKQAQACAICPRNEWKLDSNGRKGRDCSDYKRLAVLILPSQTKLLLGEALMEPVFLRVPPASLNDLAILGEAMAKKGFHYSSYITRIGFMIDKPHPQMTFRALQKLSAAEAPIVLPMREDPVAYRITGENEVGRAAPYVLTGAQSGGARPLDTGLTAASSTTTSSQPTQPASSTLSGTGNLAAHSSAASITPKPNAASATTQGTGTGSPTSSASAQATPTTSADAAAILAQMAALQKQLAATQAQPTAQPILQGEVIPPAKTTLPQNDMVVDTGFGTTAATSLPQNTLSGGPSSEDTGPAESADADLDARVAALLQ